MKRYVMFAVLGPLLSGIVLMVVSSVSSGYWYKPDSSLLKFLSVLGSALPISYMFGLPSAVLFAAVDDIICHIRSIGPVVRMVLVGAFAFVVAIVLSGTTGGKIEIEYGLAGLVPAMLLSWWAHRVSPITPPAPRGGHVTGH
ncbi:DUF5413 family protein [Bradyrhizobium prioriisuperbiae]|uniref:DUF5413 family protein n=1 Tax=Bradyrhizobium prioriisuperbiae TaxID=2854389 RepID=UPI0028E73531|nr:DUF5413 family protein [Bradyrhizobium prioritasuperba]